jgi:hypothetical protein
MSRARFQNPNFVAQQIHYHLDPANFSHSLVVPPIRHSFEAIHISETLQTIAKSDPFSRLKPYQFDILYAPLPPVYNDKIAIAAFVRQWFDIFNTAFFGGGLTELRDHVLLKDDFPDNPTVAAFFLPR